VRQRRSFHKGVAAAVQALKSGRVTDDKSALHILSSFSSAPFGALSSSFFVLRHTSQHKMLRILTLALAIYGVAAVPFNERGSTLNDPGCVASVPAQADPATVDKVYLAAVAKKVTMKVSALSPNEERTS
jgi:hypothetical protein